MQIPYERAPLPNLLYPHFLCLLTFCPPLNLHYIFTSVIVVAVTAFLVSHLPPSVPIVVAVVVITIVVSISVVLTDTTRGLVLPQYERQEERPQLLVCEVPIMSWIGVDGTFVLVLVSLALLLPPFGKTLVALVPVRPILVRRRRFLLILGRISVWGEFRQRPWLGGFIFDAIFVSSILSVAASRG